MKTTRRRVLAGVGTGVLSAAAAPRTEPAEAPLLSVFAKRQTVRRYKNDPVPDEHVTRILDAARRAPTCMNQQPWKFLVIRDRARIERLHKATIDNLEKQFEQQIAKNPNVPEADRQKQKANALAMTHGYFTAPVYVAVLVDNDAPWPAYGKQHDGPLAVGYLMLAARALGYGTAYLTDGVPDSVTREVLGIPARYHRICITPIGVPDGWPDPKPKKKLEELISYETL